MANAQYDQRNNLLRFDVHRKLRVHVPALHPRVALSSSGGHLGTYVADLNETLRAFVAQLIQTTGANQTILAKRLGLSQSWFNRWINAKDDRVLPLTALARLETYLGESIGIMTPAHQTLLAALEQLGRIWTIDQKIAAGRKGPRAPKTE